MVKQFCILFTFRWLEDFKPFARFEIGEDRKEAYALFDRLAGKTGFDDHDMLYIELMETTNGLPLNLKIKACTLEQLNRNSCTITKAVFARRLARK